MAWEHQAYFIRLVRRRCASGSEEDLVAVRRISHRNFDSKQFAARDKNRGRQSSSRSSARSLARWLAFGGVAQPRGDDSDVLGVWLLTGY